MATRIKNRNPVAVLRPEAQLLEGSDKAMSFTPPPDRGELLRLARSGNQAALGQLLEMYRSYLGLLAHLQICRRLQGKADPADLVQETFLKANRDFHQFRGEGERELAGWLRQILAASLAQLVRRYCGTKGRDIRLERALVNELDESSQALDGGLVAAQSSPSQQVSRREQAVLLADALERLPEDYRGVVVLRHLEELSFPEVAERMGRSVDSVEKLWVRALSRLRRELEGVS
jgi:RNA polymerase sigma-70 factor (ECF subfamily)